MSDAREAKTKVFLAIVLLGALGGAVVYARHRASTDPKPEAPVTPAATLDASPTSAAVDAAPGQTRIEMSPSSFLVGLAIDPIYFTFDTSTQRLLRLEGRVPTKIRDGHHWSDFDARVEYELVAAGYR